MRIPISSRLRFIWFTLIAVMVVASMLPRDGVFAAIRASYDRGWMHFLVYAVLAALAMFAWKSKTAILSSLGLFAFSVGLHMCHLFFNGRAIDYFGLIVDLLGIVAGILLGINIMVLRSRVNQGAVT